MDDNNNHAVRKRRVAHEDDETNGGGCCNLFQKEEKLDNPFKLARKTIQKYWSQSSGMIIFSLNSYLSLSLLSSNPIQNIKQQSNKKNHKISSLPPSPLPYWHSSSI